MMPFSTRFSQGVLGNSDCINHCAENILAGEANPAAPVPNEPDLLADGEALRDEQELLVDRVVSPPDAVAAKAVAYRYRHV